MSNHSSLSSPAQDYLERLALEVRHPGQRRELLSGGAAHSTLFELHQSLSPDATFEGEDAANGSILKRLELAYGASPLAPPSVLKPDADGRSQINTAPPLKRTPMAPKPWTTSPFERFSKSRKLKQGTLKPWQRKSEAPVAPSRHHWQKVGSARRWVLILLTVAQSAMAVTYMTSILPYKGTAPLEIAILILFALLFAWVSSGFWTALMGFFQLLKGRDRFSITASATPDTAIEDNARTALVMPICNEDVDRVFAGLKATYESVQRSGEGRLFDFYVLSDTYDPELCLAEQHAWMRLCKEVDGFGHIFYRRRRRRVKRKSGNIDDFCRRWGGQYRYMLVLDADSVMTGTCLKRLVQLMEANPNAGIIQSAPVAAGSNNLYSRLQQFATSVYGPLFTAGLHFWQLGESHYWGHNAIIRVEPFMYYCSLAPLPGKGALAGEILSHDFVEAALMRRAGWGVWIAYDLPGSFEEMPPSLLEELQRDRRWCHGNLMNFRLFMVRGMHPVHRAVFLTGVMSYLSAPLWFLFLVLSTAMLAVHTLSAPVYFPEPGMLHPQWPEWHPGKAVALFSTTLTLLFLPKILSVILIWVKGAKWYGGRARLGLSMVLESLFSMMLAPVRMLFHTRFVLAALLGIKIKWTSPSRDSSETPWREAIVRHGPQTILGVVWTAGVYYLDPRFLWWLAPIVGALMLSIPVSVISSKVGLGIKSRASRLFLIPDEANPARELRATKRYVRHAEALRETPRFIDAVVDPVENAFACAMGVARHGVSPALERSRRRYLEEVLAHGPSHVPNALRLQLLDDPVLLSRLHYTVWNERDRYPAWVDETYDHRPPPRFA